MGKKLKAYRIPLFLVALLVILVLAMQVGLLASPGAHLAMSVGSATPSASSASPSPGVTVDFVSSTAKAAWFMRGTDNQVWLRRPTSTGYTWQSLGGTVTSEPAFQNFPGPMFVRGTDNGIWYREATGGDSSASVSWGPWQTLGGILTSGPSTVRVYLDRYVFARGSDNGMWYRVLSGGTWSNWQAVGGGGVFSSGPAAMVGKGDVLYVVGRGTDNAMYMNYKDSGGSWAGWHSLGGTFNSGPAATEFDDYLFVFGLGTDNSLWYRRWDRWTREWGNWTRLGGGPFYGAPGVTSREGHDIFTVIAQGTDNKTWRIDMTIQDPWGARNQVWGAWSVAP